MSVTQLKHLCEDTFTRLKKVSMELERFLNEVTLASLVAESGDPEEYVVYYRTFLADLRHLQVYSENAYEKLGVCLRRVRFNEEYAEEVLHDVYHQCVNNFYYPKGEVYDGDGRNPETGEDVIVFRKEVTPELRRLISTLSRIFRQLREDLQYYETDYLKKKRLESVQS